MMYLSELRLSLLNRQVQKDLGGVYEIHRTLMSAFIDSDEGGPGRVLYRVEKNKDGPITTVLVQSEREPDWTKLRVPKDFFSAHPRKKAFDPEFVKKQVLVFRLRANPTVKRDGKRLGLLKEEEQRSWIHRKGASGGFEPLSITVIPEGFMKCTKGSSDNKLSFHSVMFEGVLRITDADTFRASIENGIGSAKGFGFGMLSVAPYRD